MNTIWHTTFRDHSTVHVFDGKRSICGIVSILRENQITPVEASDLTPGSQCKACLVILGKAALLPPGTVVIVNTPKGPYNGHEAVVYDGPPSFEFNHDGIPVYDWTMHHVRFTPPLPGHPSTDYLPRSVLTIKEKPMTKFETTFDVPDSIREFFDAFMGQGEIRYFPGNTKATFEFVAEDLWDAAQVINATKDDVDGALASMTETIDFKRPTEVTDLVEPTAPDAVVAVEVKCVSGIGQTITRTKSRDPKLPNGTFWPVAAVAYILKAHGIKVAE